MKIKYIILIRLVNKKKLKINLMLISIAATIPNISKSHSQNIPLLNTISVIAF